MILVSATFVRLKSNQNNYLAVNDANKKTLYLTTEETVNSHWKVIENSDSATIQLENVKTKTKLNRYKTGVNANNNAKGINWILDGKIIDSGKISLKSYKGDFLSSENTK